MLSRTVPPPACGPLAGITVVALEQAVSAPLCTRTLADLGARVIKIENPRGGDFTRGYDDVVHGLAAHFVWVNRGKESVTLDLKHPAGLDLLHRLLERADVLVSNLAPGATARLGIGPDDLLGRHPHVVPTADGQVVVLGTTNDAEWLRLTAMVGRPDLAADPRYRHNADRVAHREVLDSAVAAWCAGRDLVEVQERADAAGIGNARFHTPSQVVAHPHLTARDRWREIDSPAGPVTALLPPPVYPGHELRIGPVPALGEHTDAVLLDLGLDDAAIAVLRTAGAVGPRPDVPFRQTP